MNYQPEATASTSDTPASRPKNTFFWILRQHPRTAAWMLGIVFVGVLFGWQALSYRRDIRIAQELAEQATFSLRHDMLLLLAKPMVWNLRSEMMHGNMEQVQLLLQDIIKEGNFIFIHVIDPQGNVIASTDLGTIGKPVGADVTEQTLLAETPVCILDGDTRMLVSSPVMGTDRRLATLVFAYRCCTD